ncbi:hypothetical protein M758_1G217500 [Ceratodon purpureus]|nr:hypothetical protein M758_1G217500 [Ceratodon purpureus]
MKGGRIILSTWNVQRLEDGVQTMPTEFPELVAPKMKRNLKNRPGSDLDRGRSPRTSLLRVYCKFASRSLGRREEKRHKSAVHYNM